jgi:hypothetical protein
MSVSRIAGPALGGILLAAIDIPPVFLIAAFCYLPLLAVVPILAVGRTISDRSIDVASATQLGSSGNSPSCVGRS